MQPRQTEKPAVGIIYDTALQTIDDALAMALLFGFDGKKDVRVESLARSNSPSSRCGIRSRAF